MKAEHIVPGGGAVELELSKKLKDYANNLQTKEKYAVMAYAKALEVIPRTLSDNAGLDSNLILNKLRKLHFDGGEYVNYGVDVESDTGIQNSFANYVWEPIQIKRNIISAATETVCLILSIDETVTNAQKEEERKMKGYNPGPMPGQRPRFK